MSPRVFASIIGVGAMSLSLLAGEAHAAEWSPQTPWWCNSAVNVCQLYTGPDEVTQEFRHDCYLNTGWQSIADVDIFCLD